MAKRCEICGRGPSYGNRISHAHNVTRRRWHLNLHRVRVRVGGVQKRLRICTACLRSGRVQKVA